METKEFIDALRKMVEYYDYAEEKENDLNKELIMWRERFLSSLPKLDNPEKAAYIWNVFLAYPSETFLTNNPEAHIEKIAKYYESGKK
jgi:hypothetical protein